MSLNVLIIAVLVALAVMMLMVAFLMPKLSSEKRSSARLQNIRNDAGTRSARLEKRNRVEEANKRRKNVQETLKEIESKNSQDTKKRSSLNARLKQAGLTISKPAFYTFSAVAALSCALIAFIFQMPIGLIAGIAFVGGFGLPRFVLNFLAKRRIKLFLNELPDAIDIMVRGIKAGLPFADGMKLVANEAKEPLASEFKQVIEAQQLGVPIGDAIQRLYERIPVPETNFLATVITIQQSSGGSLSEALGNLSAILRERKKMRNKVKAISSEAKASAGIIGSLPILVGAAVSILNPDYMGLLIDTKVGNIALGIGAGMMMMGVFVMRKMINFEI